MVQATPLSCRNLLRSSESVKYQTGGSRSRAGRAAGSNGVLERSETIDYKGIEAAVVAIG